VDPWASFSNSCNFVSVNETTTAIDATIYPNPFNNEFIIDTKGLDAVTINVYNIMGELLKVQESIAHRITIDMDSEPAGIYFVRITSADKNACGKKITKQ